VIIINLMLNQARIEILNNNIRGYMFPRLVIRFKIIDEIVAQKL
jgi:hypothetical protein